MNREYGIGGRSLFNMLASPRLKGLGYQPAMAKMVHDRLMPKLRPLYEANATDGGGGLLVIGRKLR
jgi:hypothetical protein